MKKKFSAYLTEASNRERAEKYRQDSLDRFASDSGFLIDHLYQVQNLIQKDGGMKKHGSIAWKAILDEIERACGEKYLLWAVKQWASGKINRFEDIPTRLADGLKDYQRYINKKSIEALFRNDTQGVVLDGGSFVTKQNWKSIDTFKTFSDFETFVRMLQAMDKPEAEPESKILKRLAKSDGVEIVYQNGEDEFVIRLKSFDASKELFKDKTAWCTARSQNLYQQYSKDNPLVVMKYGPGKYWQCAEYATNIELLDQNDEKIGTRDWKDIHDKPVGKAFLSALRRPNVVQFLRLSYVLPKGSASYDFSKEEAAYINEITSSFFDSKDVIWNEAVLEYVHFSSGTTYVSILDEISERFNRSDWPTVLEKVAMNTVRIRSSMPPNLLFSYLTDHPTINLSEDHACAVIIKLDEASIASGWPTERLKFREAAFRKEVPPEESIRVMTILYGPKVTPPLARSGYFGQAVKEYALKMKESTKPRLSDLITERMDQATTLLMKLTRGAIQNVDDLTTTLMGMGFMLGAGGNSDVYYGSKGGNWVCKVSQFKEGDAAFRFLKTVFDGKLWTKNSLFPRVLGVGKLQDGYMWAILERVNPLNIQVWYEITGTVARVGTKPVFNNYFDALVSKQQPVPTTQRMINQFCDAFEINEDDLKDFLVKAMSSSGSPYLDIQMANMGLRDNGTLCIYDPVT